ncbi:MAG: hypothetical protein IE890_12930, partial [Arcobacter sp.]|nr:hypothetical protein [Arcobacter sp.]
MISYQKSLFSTRTMFFIHDLLANTLVSGENQDIFNYKFSLEEKIANNLGKDEDILLFLQENKLYEHRNKILKTIILPAILSDTLLFHLDVEDCHFLLEYT